MLTMAQAAGSSAAPASVTPPELLAPPPRTQAEDIAYFFDASGGITSCNVCRCVTAFLLIKKSTNVLLVRERYQSEPPPPNLRYTYTRNTSSTSLRYHLHDPTCPALLQSHYNSVTKTLHSPLHIPPPSPPLFGSKQVHTCRSPQLQGPMHRQQTLTQRAFGELGLMEMLFPFQNLNCFTATVWAGWVRLQEIPLVGARPHRRTILPFSDRISRIVLLVFFPGCSASIHGGKPHTVQRAS